MDKSYINIKFKLFLIKVNILIEFQTLFQLKIILLKMLMSFLPICSPRTNQIYKIKVLLNQLWILVKLMSLHRAIQLYLEIWVKVIIFSRMLQQLNHSCLERIHKINNKNKTHYWIFPQLNKCFKVLIIISLIRLQHYLFSILHHHFNQILNNNNNLSHNKAQIST